MPSPDAPAVAPRADAHPIDRADLDAARRQLQLKALPADAPWTACAAAATQLVVDPDGSVRACEHGATALPGSKGLLATWRGATATVLRDQLAAGRLPRPHCAGCVTWCAADLMALAPLLRDHGGAAAATGTLPRELVLRLPVNDTWAAPLLQDVLTLLSHVEHVALEADDLFAHPIATRVFEALRGLAKRPTLALRCRQLTDVPAATTALGELPVGTLELLAHDLAAPFAAARRLADAIGAKLLVRCVLTPHSWFQFEDIALATAAIAAPVDLRLLDRGGQAPLASLGVDDLQLVKDVLTGAWERCGSDRRPTSIAAQAFDGLLAELRALLQLRLLQALQNTPVTDTALTLPPLQHPWCTDAGRSTWWHAQLYGHGHLPCVRDWLVTAIAEAAGQGALQEHTWLRVLAQRIAADHAVPAVLESLRAAYGDAKARRRLAAADAAYAAATPLQPYGGPWAERLGLLDREARKRPFAIGKPKAPKAGATADVTVLIPSYRHQDYIEETLRSVLAQRYANLKVLVVDDGSPDDTVARARAVADPRITVRSNPQNLGLGNSVLQALATIDTPFVALLNSDDLFHPDRLGRCRDVLLAEPAVQLVTTGLSLVDQRGGELTPTNASLVLDGKLVFDWVQWFARVTPPTDLPRDQLFAALLERNFLATSSNLVCRTDWLRAQAESLQSLKYCLDWQLFLEAALAGALHHIHEPLVAYRLHATNTVWFREGRRWSYYLEVNRVAAQALRAFTAHAGDRSEGSLVRVLDALALHLAGNRETDGFALFLNTVFDALQVDQVAASSPRVQELVQRLNTMAEEVRAARDRAAAVDAPHDPRLLALRVGLGELAEERSRIERDNRRWLRGYADSLQARLEECWVGRNALEQDKQALQQTVDRLETQRQQHERRVQDLEGELRRSEQQRAVTELGERTQQTRAEVAEGRSGALLHDLTALRGDLAQARGSLAAIHEAHKLAADELQVVRRELEAAHTRNAQLAGEAETLRRQGSEQLEQLRAGAELQLAALRQELTQERLALEEARTQAAEQRGANEDLQDEVRQLARQQEDLQQQLLLRARQYEEINAALAHEADHVRKLGLAQGDLELARQDLEARLARQREETARQREQFAQLLRSREYRAGNFLWNKMPLGYMSRRGKKWYRRLVDAKDRALMVFKRRRKVNGTAVVAACWQWPIYSHTFVYQEMIGLTHMGLDLRMFHWDLGDTAQLHKAFAYLADHRTQLQPIWENHVRDKEHFDKTKPGKLRAFLERVAKATGRTVDDLEKEPMVLQGCTFARMAELAGANYLHSYFFYDQSFMAMQAAWLLDLPRGVSCYADHMLNDYPFKLVPLHVELCSVIVATSARIKRELSAMTNGRFDDKIIVKPNGVDGARFPPVVRQDRAPKDPFEVISISRIEPKKGLTHLVEAVADLKKKGHKVVAHIVGSKDPHSKGSLEYATAFEQRIKDLGVEKEVILHGMKKQEELPPILQRCRAFVAPYVEMGSGDKDGIPTAMLEGLASGLPVVTTDSGSILEVVTTEVEGIVVPQRDSKAFAAALERLIADPALERRMAKAARARFDREFDIRVTEVRLHERVAKAIAAQRKKKP